MIIINIITISLSLIFFIATRRYEKEYFNEIDTKEEKLKFLYPSCFFLIKLYQKTAGRSFHERNVDALKMLCVNEDTKLVTILYYCKKTSVCIIIFFICNIFSIYIIASDNTSLLLNGYYLLRPDSNENKREYTLDAVIEDAEQTHEQKIGITVNEKRHTDEELQQVFDNAIEYIDKTILGDNTSLDEIKSNLNLVTKIPNSKLEISWEWERGWMNEKGELKEVEKDLIPDEGILSYVTANIKYYEVQTEYTVWFRLMPQEIDSSQELYNKLSELIKESDKKSESENLLELPSVVNDKSIIWKDKDKKDNYIILFLGIIIPIFLFYARDEELQKKIKKREEELLKDYPEIVNKFTLLLGAGMTIKGAWQKIISEYKERVSKDSTQKRYVYEEMLITWYELSMGTSELKAYDRFGRRMNLQSYLKFSTLIVQNLKKGAIGLSQMLEIESMEAFEGRKQLAKRLGEEAGTKLLIPMFIMLIIVMIIIMMPAFMSLGM